MGQTSQSGQVIFATQSAAGVPVLPAALATDGLSVKIRSGSLAGNRDLLVPDPEIGGGRDTSDAYLGGVSFSGDYDMYVRFRAVAFFLANTLGVKATVAVDGVDGAFEHTITPSDGQVPFMTVYEEIGDGLERFIYTDVVCNTFHLEADANGLLSSTVGLIGRMVAANAAPIDGTALIDNTSMVPGTNVIVKYNGVQLPAKSFSLDITNNFEDDNHYLGSFYLGDLTAKSREITASALLRHEDSARMRQALFGASTATQIGGLTTKEPLQIVINAYEDVVGSSPVGTKYSLTLDLPKVIFEPFAFEPSGDDALENDVSMRAVRPDRAVPIMTAVVVNGNEDIE